MKKIIYCAILLFLINIKSNSFALEISECAEYGYIHIYNLAYSPDAKTFWFLAFDWWKRFAVINWEKSKRYDSLSSLKFSWDSTSYIILWGDWEKQKLILKGEEQWEYRFIESDNSFYDIEPKISFNWENYIIVANNEDDFDIEKSRRSVIKDWKNIWEYDKVYKTSFSWTWKNYAYSFLNSWTSWIVKDWVILEWYDKYDDFSFSRTTDSFVYVWFKDNFYHLILNDKEIYKETTPFYDINFRVFDDALIFLSNHQYKLFKDWKVTNIDTSSYRYKDHITFSKNWENYIYLWSDDIVSGTWFIVKDGKEIIESNGIYNFQLSTDLQSYAFWSLWDIAYVIKDWNKLSDKYILEYIYSPIGEDFTYTVSGKIKSSNCKWLNLKAENIYVSKYKEKLTSILMKLNKKDLLNLQKKVKNLLSNKNISSTSELKIQAIDIILDDFINK